MRFTSFAADGINGLRFSHNLGPVNVLIGPNFAGKTARLNAVRLAVMGYLPELGKTNVATMSLAGNGVLTTSVKTDQGSGRTRSWVSGKGGAIKAATEGDLPETPGVLMDSSEYFNLGEKDQTRYVFRHSRVEAPEFTCDAIIAAVKSIKVEGHGEAHEKAIGQQVGFIDSNDRVRHEADISIQDWIEQLIVEMRDRLKLSRASATRMSESVRARTVLTAGEEASQTRDCEAELKQATEQAGVLRGTIAGLERERDRLNGVIERRTKTEQTIALALDLREAIEQAELGLTELRAKCDVHKSQHATVAARLREASNDHVSARTKHGQLKVQIEQENAEHKRNLAAKACPHCGADAEGWQASIVKAHEVRMRDMDDQMVDAMLRLTSASKTVAELETEMKTAIAADDVNDKRRKELSRMQAGVDIMRRQQSELDQARAMLAGIEPVDHARLTALSADITGKTAETARLNGQVTDLTQRHRAHVQWRQDEARAAQAILAAQAAQAEVDVLKEVVKIIEALQVAMVRKAFETILSRANRVTQGILLSPLEYRDGEIGRFEGGTWIGHRTFSGTEKALCYAGISVALAWDAPVKIVLMDELGRMDSDNQDKLIQRMIELTAAGLVDQFVGAATEWPATTEGLNVIRL